MERDLMQIIDNRTGKQGLFNKGDFVYIIDEFGNKKLGQVVCTNKQFTIITVEDGHWYFDMSSSLQELHDAITEDYEYTLEIIPNEKVTITIND